MQNVTSTLLLLSNFQSLATSYKMNESSLCLSQQAKNQIAFHALHP